MDDSRQFYLGVCTVSHTCFIFKNLACLSVSIGMLIGLFGFSAAYGVPPGFSSTEWEEIVKTAIQLGYIPTSKGAENLAPALSVMKSVFEEVGLKEPSPKHLFRAISHFTNDAGFHRVSPLETATALQRAILALKLEGKKIASREELEKLQVEEKFDTRKDVKIDLVLIPAGKFKMGSPKSEKNRDTVFDETQHEVTLTKPFYMGKYEVTQEQWVAVMGYNPSRTKGANLPVTNVMWEHCQDFIKKLNAKTKGNYRLPTEAEWEYACRAGTATPYSFGDSLTENDANISAPPSKLKKVGSYKPNAFGLYDMHGNVWEWCEDGSGDYPKKPVTDPKAPVNESLRCVLRGGGFTSEVGSARSSTRSDKFMLESSFINYYTVGFRLAKTADLKTEVSPAELKLEPAASDASLLISNVVSKMDVKTFLKNHPKAIENKTKSDDPIFGRIKGYREFSEGYYTYGFLNDKMIAQSLFLIRNETSWKPIIEKAVKELGKPTNDKLPENAAKEGVVLQYVYDLTDSNINILYFVKQVEPNVFVLGERIVDKKALEEVTSGSR